MNPELVDKSGAHKKVENGRGKTLSFLASWGIVVS